MKIPDERKVICSQRKAQSSCRDIHTSLLSPAHPSTPPDRRSPAAPEFARAGIFRDLPADQLRLLEAIAVPRQLRSGQYLFRREVASPGLVYIASGCISLRRPHADGSDFVIRVFRAGETFAEATLIPEGRTPADARAESESRVLIFPRKDILEIIRAEPGFALHLIASLSRRVHTLVALSETRIVSSPRERILIWLVDRLPQEGVISCSISPGLSMASLAAELGMRPETFSRHLTQLTSEGFISRAGRRIDVLDVAKLRSVVAQG